MTIWIWNLALFLTVRKKNQIMKKNILLALFAMTIIVFSCKKETPATFDCAGVTPTYNGEIKALLDKGCATANCHSAAKKADGKDYSTYTSVKTHTSDAHFLGSIQHLSGYSQMPKGSDKWSDADIKKISCWVSSGAPEK